MDPAMRTSEDTIAAIATAPGEAGISIVRISGPAALAIADGVFKCPGPRPSERRASSAVFGHVVDEQGRPIDEAMLLIMKAPHSYTREDTVEFQGHGGTVNARRILRRVLGVGARAAEPGEFTKRAFLNGRLDLVQAEAVLDLIRAKSDRAAIAAMTQLSGDLSQSINDIYNDILGVAADVEATLDFSEEEIPCGVLDNVTERLRAADDLITKLLGTWNEGHILREGAAVVISGKPNAGKSTLLNALVGRDRAIVSDSPGTTRDIIDESVSIDGAVVKLVDTAGLRNSDCEIEREGVRRSLAEIDRADIHLYVVDSSIGVDEQDVSNLSRIGGSRCIVVINKVDLNSSNGCAPIGFDIARVSSKTGAGINDLRAAIGLKLRCGLSSSGYQQAVISERHRALLSQAREKVEAAMGLFVSHGSSDLASTELRDALDLIGRVTGRSYYDDMLGAIFSRFCIGK
jgi:tRNA modification GTPase